MKEVCLAILIAYTLFKIAFKVSYKLAHLAYMTMNKPDGYDNGGWLMPGKLAYNETSEPEFVYTNQ